MKQKTTKYTHNKKTYKTTDIVEHNSDRNFYVKTDKAFVLIDRYGEITIFKAKELVVFDDTPKAHVIKTKSRNNEVEE